jgi:hypothetical protein
MPSRSRCSNEVTRAAWEDAKGLKKAAARRAGAGSRRPARGATGVGKKKRGEEVIYLAGLPDVPESRPHSEVNGRRVRP